MKSVLITGASRGIGAAMAELFATNGYKVAINYNSSELQALQLYNNLLLNNPNIMLVKADISKDNEVLNMVQAVQKNFGKIDVLVNNAAIASTGFFIEEANSQTQQLVNVNLLGTLNVTKNVSKIMVNQKYGRIINISSVWGNVGACMEVTYSATKAAIIGLTKALAKELCSANILVNCICPGVIDTDMNSNLTKQEIKELTNKIPLSRIGTPQDIANLALFLAGESASYITGQVITVDGGFAL